MFEADHQIRAKRLDQQPATVPVSFVGQLRDYLRAN